ncbi:CLUMA_CG014427, isoform A [Clunio marinus]|uniref:Sepiapterin reductase n=1 Tax=Clunio marinus TaxID=568069 RepID=A0A1J1IM43_9DIPT|nr:CLUMA_CG014427, isoform A [Clunio marinus]
MSAWAETVQAIDIKEIDKQFEDNFVTTEVKEFKKLEDSDQYLKSLESKLKKIKKDPSVLKQLKEKREECLNNLLNSSLTSKTNQDFELEETVQSNEIIRHLVPAQAQTIDIKTGTMSNPIDLKGKLAYLLVTGASKGIGATMAIETSRHFKSGSVVVLLARSQSGLEATKTAILEANACLKVVIKAIDLTKPSTEDLNLIIHSSYDKSVNFDLTMIIHNVGTVGDISKWSHEIEDYNVLENYYSTNIFSPIILNNLFLKVIPESMKKFIVNITSKAAKFPFKSMGFYCQGKAAREMFFNVLAEERSDVLVLNYAPGPVETDMTVDLQANSVATETSNMFENLRKTKTILTTEQTIKRFLEIEMRSNFHETFIFLTKLMWKNRIILPAMISVAFLVCNFRWEIEISIQTERIQMPNNDDNDSDDGSIGYTSNDEFEVASSGDDDFEVTSSGDD